MKTKKFLALFLMLIGLGTVVLTSGPAYATQADVITTFDITTFLTVDSGSFSWKNTPTPTRLTVYAATGGPPSITYPTIAGDPSGWTSSFATYSDATGVSMGYWNGTNLLTADAHAFGANSSYTALALVQGSFIFTGTGNLSFTGDWTSLVSLDAPPGTAYGRSYI